MEAAITAAKRGHDVTLVEQSGRLGGNLLPAGTAYFKEDIRKLVQVLEGRIRKNWCECCFKYEGDTGICKTL